jgi:hypothetical protein
VRGGEPSPCRTAEASEPEPARAQHATVVEPDDGGRAHEDDRVRDPREGRGDAGSTTEHEREALHLEAHVRRLVPEDLRAEPAQERRPRRPREGRVVQLREDLGRDEDGDRDIEAAELPEAAEDAVGSMGLEAPNPGEVEEAPEVARWRFSSAMKRRRAST